MRIDTLIQETKRDPEPDFSVLTDSELDFYINTLEKAGYDWNKNGNLSVLTDEERERLNKLHQKTIN